MSPDPALPPASAACASSNWARSRVILCHFDSYSTALVFARWPDRSLLAPGPLPEGSQPSAGPPDPRPDGYDGAPVKAATAARYGLNPAELVEVPEFDEWLTTPEGPLRVHLLRFTTFEAPAALLEPHAGVFKPISELRGSDPAELALLRVVFNLIIGGGGRA